WRDAAAGMLPPGPKIRRVVDLGCGTGRFTGLLADVYGTSVVGVEPSSRMLTGREPLAAARGTVLAATAEALPLATGAIDLVFLSLVYHHLGAKTAALAELRRVARAGGHVIVRQVTGEYHRKISLRGLSSLQAISDGAFARGLAAFER